MYHEEKIINGILHWRGTPTGSWKRYSYHQLAEKIVNADIEVRNLKGRLEQIANFCEGVLGNETLITG